MNKKSGHSDSYQTLLLLDEISKNNNVTQRDLSKKLGLALGLINSYMKNLISKGYVTINNIPRNRYRYLLTPRGLSEKTRLTYTHLQNFTNLYRVARKDFKKLFDKLEKQGVKTIALCGVDEVTEIAYISLQEFSLELVSIVDVEKKSRKFFTKEIRMLEDLRSTDVDRVIITSFLKEEYYYSELLKAGIPAEKIMFKGSGLKDD